MVLVLEMAQKLNAVPLSVWISIRKTKTYIPLLDTGLVHCLIVSNNLDGHDRVGCFSVITLTLSVLGSYNAVCNTGIVLPGKDTLAEKLVNMISVIQDFSKNFSIVAVRVLRCYKSKTYIPVSG